MQIFFSTEFNRARARHLYIIYKRAQVFLGEIYKRLRSDLNTVLCKKGKIQAAVAPCFCRLSFFYTLNLGLFFLNSFMNSTRATTPSWGMEL